MKPTQSASTSSSQQLPRTATQVATDLKYLREQRICEKLEYLVKQLLKQQPEDPVLFICSQLRERLAASRSTSDDSWWLHKDVDARVGGQEDAVCVDDGGSVSQVTTSPSAPHPPAPHTAPQGGTTSAFPPAHLLSGGAAAANTPGASAGPNGAMPFSGSLRTSRVTTPAAARPSTTGRGGLERDESAKSDQSYFSIASVDMQEFLSEFRVARNEFMGTQCERITRNDLAEIVDRVSIPLPDVRLIADLFDEMVLAAAGTLTAGRPMSSDQHASSSMRSDIAPQAHHHHTVVPISPTDSSVGFPRGSTLQDGTIEPTVPFEAFLARMNFKIQGRYPNDVVRQVYLSLLRTNSEPAPLPLAQHRGSGEAATNLITAPINAVVAVGGPKAAPVEISQAADAAGGVALRASGGVPRGRAITEGLWLGLGIRIAPAELQRVTTLLGIGPGDNVLLQLTDFSSLVAAATGQAHDQDGLMA